MELVAIVVFALAVSADGFGAGVAYGVRNIRIPIFSLTIICLASMFVVSISMLLGQSIAWYLSPHLASILGATILMIMGMWLVMEAFKSTSNGNSREDTTILTLRVRPLGIIIRILKEPARADFDQSGEISAKEAFFLGLALSLDALAAGMGVAMAGYNILLTALLVGTTKFVLVNVGLRLGKCVSNSLLKRATTLISGLILLALGILEIY